MKNVSRRKRDDTKLILLIVVACLYALSYINMDTCQKEIQAGLSKCSNF